MKFGKAFFLASCFLVVCLLLPLSEISGRTHIVQFGGSFGFTYQPNLLYVAVGDTIQWNGDFTTYALQSTSIPAGAAAIGPVTTGNTFTYAVQVAGTYNYQNNTYAQIGMTGSFIAILEPHGSLTNEGTEFFLGMMYPSYNTVAVNGIQSQYFHVDALITTYYDNQIRVSYYDQSGAEINASTHILAAKHSLDLRLDDGAMQTDSNSESPAYKSCHITSKYPIAVHYLSAGGCSGGSYLALPALGLGKNYVIASYNDNPGGGALFKAGVNNLPSTYENAGGEFMIIATEDATGVTITPNTTTRGNHAGMHTGAGSNGVAHPFSVTLNKGQTYLLRSDGKDDNNDISGSVVEATKPIGVLAGHEDAFFGGTDPYIIEGRDFMIEQMVPVELWDSTGYVSIPLPEGLTSGSTTGEGDMYRVYAYDNTNVNVQADVLGISGGNQITVSRLASPTPELTEITAPVDFHSTDGHKINVMQYDERSQSIKFPWPAPSMMTVVPKSRWKKSFDFYIPTHAASEPMLDYSYVSVILPSRASINVTVDGGATSVIGSFPQAGNFLTVSNNYDIKGIRYKIPSGSSYRLTSDSSFMAYIYAMRDIAIDTTQLGLNDSLNLQSEYAAPAGMQLNNGVIPSLSIVVDTLSKCTGWHICVTDLGKNDPGVKGIMFIDDTEGIYFGQIGAKPKNVSFDPLSSDLNNGELQPHWNSSDAYCFDVNVSNVAAAATAPLAIFDNGGNATIITLQRSAPSLTLSTIPASTHPDSVYFPPQQIGTQVCTTFVIKNTAAAGSQSINLISAQLKNSDSVFSIQSINPPLPLLLAPQSSDTLQLCFTSKDDLAHYDSLFISTDCFSIPVSIQEFSSTGLIIAGDLDFDSVKVGNEVCKDLLIKNTGSAPFTLTRIFKLFDVSDFALSQTFINSLPLVIQPGQTVTANLCFHPQSAGFDSSGIDWGTNIDALFSNLIKNHSVLKGTGIPSSSVKEVLSSMSFSLVPNPAFGNSVTAYFSSLTDVRTVLTIHDVLGREVYHINILPGMSPLEIPLRNLPPGLYYAQLTSEGGVLTQKLEIVK